MPTDLAGKNALLSDHFFYFGDAAPTLPAELRPIAQNRQGHRVNLNRDFIAPFLAWVEKLDIEPRTLVGAPLMRNEDDASRRWCATCRADDDEQDEEVVTVSSTPC